MISENLVRKVFSYLNVLDTNKDVLRVDHINRPSTRT